MPDEITLRDCHPDDVSDVLQLWAHSGAVPGSTDSLVALRTRLLRDRELFLLAVNGGRIIGAIIGGWDGWRGNLYRLVVHPEYRRRGVATQLVAEIERRLRAMGARRVYALALDEEPGALALWRRAGYEPNPIVRPYAKMLD